ncbi:glycosyltransferase family 4 protein [Flagellimonas sp. DF-77]|uniref:glycosyltransferase family 4 protein n=1 Tax=Flagellimonas algarum TaxID=3230298 RepID=UPI003391CC02
MPKPKTNPNLRNLHLVVFAYGDRGHTKEYVSNFCSRLHHKYNITLYIGSTSKVEEPEHVNCVYINVDIAKVKAERFLKFGRLSNLFKNLKKQGLIIRYCREVLAKKNIQKDDVVYIMDYTAPSLFVLFRGLSRIRPKVYLWVHSARFKSKDLVYSLYKKMVQFILNRLGSKVLSGIVVNGDYIKAQLPGFLDFDADDIHVIQYPSEIEFSKIDKSEARKQLGLPKNEDIVLFFGGLRTDKNIEEVVRSTAMAKNKPLLIVAGSESTVSKQVLESWLAKHGHENYFLDISYVSEEKMALYYSASDVMLLTYNSESASQSGPLSLAREFLLPAIVTDAGEIGYYITKNNIGLVASPDEQDDYTEKVETFFNSDHKARFEKALQETKQRFSWENAAAKYHSLFKSQTT